MSVFPSHTAVPFLVRLPNLQLLIFNSRHSVRVEICNLPEGTYGVYHNGVLAETRSVGRPGHKLDISVQVGGGDFDLVLLKA